MKHALILLLFNPILSFAQLTKAEGKSIDKAEKAYQKGNLYRATVFLEPVLEKHQDRKDLWELMIKYQHERLANAFNLKAKTANDTLNRAQAIDMFYKEFIEVLINAQVLHNDLNNYCTYQEFLHSKRNEINTFDKNKMSFKIQYYKELETIYNYCKKH